MITLTVAIVSLYVPGRRHSVEDYGYDLSNLLVRQDLMAATGRGRLEIRPLNNPLTLSVAELDEANEKGRGKLLVSADRVVGVVVGGESRAYPLRAMNWHEVVNDTLGGIPIAVTYSPLSDSVVVFDRRLGEEVLEFRHSALLYNSNLLMQNWKEGAESDPDFNPSLFSQLQFRAISGPHAGQELTVLPMEVTTWGAWKEKLPETRVIRGLEDYEQRKLYRKNPYGPYLLTGELKFPAQPLPAGAEQDPKTRMARVLALANDAGGWNRSFLSDLASMAEAPVRVHDSNEYIVFEFPAAPTQPAVYACNFAWHAVRFEIENSAPTSE
ncbi:MAG: DUF3179 domain-containing (seleno)protein [Phycisphaerales bacterium JB038]